MIANDTNIIKVGSEFMKPQSTRSNSLSSNKNLVISLHKFVTENGSTLGVYE